jgi:hypothetical protein
MATVLELETSSASRHAHALRRLTRAWSAVWKDATPDDLEKMASHVEAAYQPEAASDGEAAFVRALSEGRSFSREDRIALEREAQERYFAHRRQLLEGALTTMEVARRLNTTRQTPHDRVRRGTLLAIEDKGRLCFPAWQFDAQGPHGVVAGLPDVLRALNVAPLAKASWLLRSSPCLEDRSPLQTLQAGEKDRVLSMAHGVETLKDSEGVAMTIQIDLTPQAQAWLNAEA